jgi:hypothetical protein
MLDKIFGEVNWLCFLIDSGEIKDRHLVNYFKGRIIEWHDLMKYLEPKVVKNPRSFRHFKIIYDKSIKEKCQECDHAREYHGADVDGNHYCANCQCSGFAEKC